jgi:predicted methyltransferase
MRNRIVLGVLLLAAIACGGGSNPPSTASNASAQPTAATSTTSKASPEAQAVVNAADRDPGDKELDAGRRPAEMLTFYGVKPGMKLLEIAAAGGYTSEILGRAVGASGTVYAQNNAWILEKFADKTLSARLAKPVNKNMVKVVREFDDPIPPEAKDLDGVFIVLIYHDLFWLNDGKIDRAKMNAAVLKALKPGGFYAIIDHSGRPGTGAKEVNTIHRIEEKVIREEVEKAGFKLAAEGDFLRHPEDTRDWDASPGSPKRGQTDRFALKYVKP